MKRGDASNMLAGQRLTVEHLSQSIQTNTRPEFPMEVADGPCAAEPDCCSVRARCMCLCADDPAA